MPQERAAKLSGEGENRARQAAIVQDALNKYKGSIDAEAKAKAAYAAHGKRVENDPCMMGRDWHSAGLEAAELANTWEKAANRYVSCLLSGHRALCPRLMFLYEMAGSRTHSLSQNENG